MEVLRRPSGVGCRTTCVFRVKPALAPLLHGRLQGGLDVLVGATAVEMDADAVGVVRLATLNARTALIPDETDQRATQLRPDHDHPATMY